MAAEITTARALQCGGCGNPYRRSYFDRECSCPVCGRNLQTGSSGVTSRWSARYLATTASLLAVVVLSGVALKALQRRSRNVVAAATAPLADLPPPFTPTADFRDALATKAKLLEQDLALAPEDPFLIASLSETYLYRALAEYQLEGSIAKARPWLRRSEQCVNRLHDRAPFASFRLREVLQHFPNVRFNSLGWPSVTASLWRLQVGRSTLFTAPSLNGVPYVRRRRDVTGLPPPADIAPNSPATGPGPYPGPPLYGGPTGGGGGSFFGDRPAAPAPLPPGYPGSLSLRIPGNGSSGPGGGPGGPGMVGRAEESSNLPDEELRLAELRQQVAAQPDDLFRADQLAGELLRASAAYQPAIGQSETQRKSRQRIEEAAEVCVRAASKARLRVQRAAFYSAAADARRRLEQWEAQYELLGRTAENAPFAPAVWHDLKTAALRLGKLDESIAANKNEVRWQFPAIESADGANQ